MPQAFTVRIQAGLCGVTSEVSFVGEVCCLHSCRVCKQERSSEVETSSEDFLALKDQLVVSISRCFRMADQI